MKIIVIFYYDAQEISLFIIYGATIQMLNIV